MTVTTQSLNKLKKYKNREAIRSMIKLARKYSGMTQEELAKKLKTTQPNIARAENQICTTIEFAERIIRACGFSLRFNVVSIENEKQRISDFTDYER